MRPRLLRWVVTVLAGGLVTAGVFVAGASMRVIGPPPGDPAADILYLPDPVRPSLDLDRARADGARIAPSAESLQADASPNVIGIVFDASQLASVSRPWLASQFEQGRVIVGIGVSMVELEAAVGPLNFGPPDGFRQDWRGQPFYSVVYRSAPGANPSYSGRASDQLTSPELLFAVMRRYVRQAEASPTSAPMPSPYPGAARP